MDQGQIEAAIKQVGDEIRAKKEVGEDIKDLIPQLQELKRKFEEVTGRPFDPPKEKKKKKKEETKPATTTDGAGPSKNELKKAAKAAKKAEKKATHKATAGGETALPPAPAVGAKPAASPAKPAAKPAAKPSSAGAKELWLTGAPSTIDRGSIAAVASVDAVKCLAAATPSL